MATLEELLAQAETEAAASQAVGTPGQQALQAGAGTALNFADTLLFGLPSKGIAAGQAVASDLAGYFTGQSPQDYYTQELAKVERLKKIGEAATADAGLTGWSEALSFMAPLPGKKAEALWNLAKPAKEAGLGLASYFGSEAGQALTDESPYGSLVGALAAPLSLQGGLAGGRKLVGALSPSLEVLKGSDEALQQLASKEILKAAGEEGAARLAVAQQMPELLTSPLGRTLTAAEIAQTPGLANVQLQMAKGIEEGKPLVDALITAKTEQDAALNALGVTPQKGQLSEALRSAATANVTAKAQREAGLLESLGLSPEAKAASKTEAGINIRENIQDAFEKAKEADSLLWEQVPMSAKIDVTESIENTLKGMTKYGLLTKSRLSKDARMVLRRARSFLVENPETGQRQAIVSIKDFQDLRRNAGEVMAAASGKNPTEVNIMGDLREQLDTLGYADAEKSGASVDALGALQEAIASTKQLKQTFSKGAVGDIQKVRGFEPSVKTSQVLDRALKNPENAFDIVYKLGKDSVAGTELRYELLRRVEAQNNPGAYLKKNQDVFKVVFGDDYSKLSEYAKSKASKSRLEDFAKIEDTTIPKIIFGDAKRTKAFMDRFKGTEAELLARGKFVQQLQSGKGTLRDRYESSKSIAKELFGDDVKQIEKIIDDIELSTSPQRVAQMATGKQSITTQGMTTIGWLLGARSMLKSAKGLKVAGPAYALANWANPPAWLAGGLAYKVGDMASKSDAEVDRLMVEMLRDPSLIKFAAAPVSEKSTKNFVEEAARLGYFGAKSQFTTDEDELAAQELLNSL